MMSVRNLSGGVLAALIIFLILAGFTAFRIFNGMTGTATNTVNHPLGKLNKAGILDGGVRHHSCYGYLLLNRNVRTGLQDPLVRLLGDNGNVLAEATYYIPGSNDDFVVRIPEGHSGFASIEAPSTYRIHTRLANNGFYSLFPAGKFTGTVRGHAFVLRGETLPEPEPLPRTTLIIETAKGWRQEVQTDGIGGFNVEIPPGPFTLLVRSDSHSDAFFDDLSVKAGETLDRQIILPAGCELEGFVLGNNVTLEGAKVSLVTSLEDDAETIAGDRGQFNLPGLTQGLATIYIQHPGYQEESFNLLVPGDKIGIRKPFLLKPSQEFTATAVLEGGATVSDAQIQVQRSGQLIFDGPIGELNRMNILASGQTYIISARYLHQPGNPSAYLLSPRQTWTMPADGPGVAKLVLREGSSITGIVQTARSWQPYGGASVKIEPVDAAGEGSFNEIVVWCDPAGRFKSPMLPLGKYAVAASHPHFGMQGKLITLTAPGESSVGFITLPE